MKSKGIILAVILTLASIMMPFDVYAAVQSQIVPTFSSSTSQWNGHLYLTNFSDGTNNQASSTLSFTFDDDYYGIIYFDGYGPSNQHIANYAACFIAGGYGEYRYSYYQNGVINITDVTINIVNVVKPDSSVDLTQIIDLLTAIESDTSAIDNLLDSQLSQIRSILNQLIVSNGYLDLLTKFRQWNFPTESLSSISLMYVQNYEEVEFYNNSAWTMPIFKVNNGNVVGQKWVSANNPNLEFILIKEGNLTYSNVTQWYSVNDASFQSVLEISYSGLYSIYKIVINPDDNFNGFVRVTALQTHKICPIYFQPIGWKYNSVDFALKYGLTNQMLEDIHLIAQGTGQSNSAASGLEQSNNQMASDMNSLATIESGYNQQFNNQLQSIDFTSPIQNNAGILPAANFVISIFNGLINNNPFSVLIIVVCILLIGKKVIGK